MISIEKEIVAKLDYKNSISVIFALKNTMRVMFKHYISNYSNDYLAFGNMEHFFK